MKRLDAPEIDRYRMKTQWVLDTFGSIGDHNGGLFVIDELRVIASNGEGWDHVSVSRSDRCPTWEEMEAIKRLFFESWEVAMQLHVAQSDHISFHPYTLHIWRPHNQIIPLPPKIMVGPG